MARHTLATGGLLALTMYVPQWGAAATPDQNLTRIYCRAPMGHEYEFGWAWKLILDFFDAQSSSLPAESRH